MTCQWTVDAFAHAPFSGNPACVVEPMDAWPETAWMQALAMENNQAETAFLRRTDDRARFDLRWFTPMQEVRLCGHATLAAAHVLMAELAADAPRVAFDTLSGRLTVERGETGYQMDFPADPPVQIPVPEGLAEALGAPVLECWAARYLVAIVPDADTVRRLRPDIRGLDRLDCDAASEAGHVIVAALDESGQVDVVDRFFAPGCGVDEDPATGSAHCILGPLYADKLGRDTVRFLQAYPRRGGHIETQTAGDRVLIRGRAVTVMDSRLRGG